VDSEGGMIVWLCCVVGFRAVPAFELAMSQAIFALLSHSTYCADLVGRTEAGATAMFRDCRLFISKKSERRGWLAWQPLPASSR
jgi:hypothetical protein